MPVKRPTKPIFEDEEGSIRVAIFKNKNSNGKTYPMITLTAIRFPFKFCSKLHIRPTEVEKVIKLLERLPEIEKKKK